MKKFIRLPLAAIVLSLLVVASLFAGCARPAAPATPTPTRTPHPPTDTPVPATPTLEPTATPVPPTDTPEPTATATATLTPTLSVMVLPREEGVSIFTGLRPADPSVLQRRPLAIKVDNDPAVVPQSGMGKADVVVESPKEACMTRFTAIFQSQSATRIGSIRSARIVDKELPVIFDAILAFSGAVGPVRQMLYESDLKDQILEQALNGGAFFRDPNIKVPFNLFASTDTLWSVAAKKGWNNPPEATAAWVFSEGAPEGGAPATSMSMPFPKALPVSWAYNATTGRWARSIGGNPHIDKAEGQQLTAANVVVLTVNTVQTLIPEQGSALTQGACSNASVEVQLWGEGPVRILRDGQVYAGTWVRAGRDAPFRFVDAQGRDIPLKPGNSWWQIVAPSVQVTIK